MPYFGLLPFLPQRNRGSKKQSNVSMPYFGLLPFLLFEVFFLLTINNCFNALLRASSFSTEMTDKERTDTQMFQCPTSGFFLFYQDKAIHRDVEIQHCFNALLRASSFSTCYHKEVITCYGGFQCPTSGFFLFYKGNKFNAK